MDAQTKENLILKTFAAPSLKFYLALGATTGGVLWFVYAWSFALGNGLITTSLADWGPGGGSPWGLFIGAYIWWIGIAHGGIIISAAVRLFDLTTFRPVARMAELLTLFALSMAALFIVFHLGRPDRMVISILQAYPWTVFSSPLAWDVTVITLYFVLTATYILLTIRRDLYVIRSKVPVFLAPVYDLLLMGYHPEQDEKTDKMVWWLALCVIILAPLFLHGGVIPWLFAVVPTMPGFFGGIQGPTFLSIALTSALSGVIVVAYLFRRIYGWHELLPDAVFNRLTFFLIIMGILFLWLQIQVILTGLYASPVSLNAVVHHKVETPLYWVAIAMVVGSLAYLGAQRIWPSLFNIHRTAIAALFPLLGTLLEKTLFVVEGLMQPEFSLYRAVPGAYWPSWIEVSSVIGTVCVVVLLFTVIGKVVPVIEISEEEEPGDVVRASEAAPPPPPASIRKARRRDMDLLPGP
jgi:molybdopterin-containing oxidoreductase family membrane subunit